MRLRGMLSIEELTKAFPGEHSELQNLLLRNAYGKPDLTKEEMAKAEALISIPVFSEDYCWLCKHRWNWTPEDQRSRAIYDTGLCKWHARQALYDRK